MQTQTSSNQAPQTQPREADAGSGREKQERGFLTLMVNGQLCGVPVLAVRDVISNSIVTRIPLAPPEIAGNINLRGRIVTAIDLRRRLSLTPAPAGSTRVAVVAEEADGGYALLVDQALEVLTLDMNELEVLPPTLAASWTEFSSGIFRLPERLLVVLDISRLLFLETRVAAS